MTGFVSIMTETMPAGLLPQISAGLGVPPALSGQLVSIYALGSLLAAIPLTILTAHWPRRHVLLATLVGFTVFNTVTALSSNYTLIMGARLLAGAAAGLAWSLIPGYARQMVRPEQRGKAMAIAMIGTPIALALGVPLGTWLGSLTGWRMAFGVMTGVSIALVLASLLVVPNLPGQSSSTRLGLKRVFMIPGVRPVLFVSVLWMLAHNVLYTYIAPFVVPAALEARVDLVLLVFGMAAIVGIAAAGKLVDAHLRTSVLSGLVVFAIASTVLGVFGSNPIAVFIGVMLWGITFGGAATLLQTALADAAGDGAEVALSMSVVAWNLAIALGGALGGVLIVGLGGASIPWVMLGMIILALVVSALARAHGFTAGTRRGAGSVAAH